MPSSSRLYRNPNKLVPGMMRLLCYSVCLGALLLLCVLYFTDMTNDSLPLPAAVSPRKVPRNPFGNGIKKLNNYFKFNSLIDSRKGQYNSRNNVHQNRRGAKKLLISPRLQDFQKEWLRQRRARVDWKNIIKPCADNTAWGFVKEHWGKINRSNITTSDIIFKDIRSAGEFSKIFIQSKTSDNRTKLIGGDTWRVYVRGPTSIAATVFDHDNGTYEALFLITEPGVYQLMIYLDYSLCDGFKDPPRDWFIVGDVQGNNHQNGILGPLDEYLIKHGHRALNITVTKARLKAPLSDKLEGLGSCSETCKYLWDGFGQWKNEQWMPYLEESYNWTIPQKYKKSGTLWFYGDSVSKSFYKSAMDRTLCTSLYTNCGNSYMWIYGALNRGLNITLEGDLDFRPKKVIETVTDIFNEPEMQQEESVLLLNLVLHFTKAVNFSTYQRLIDDLIVVLKETELSHGERVPKYKAKIIWKSSTALCKENVSQRKKQLKETDFRFFTSQRVVLFHAYSMLAMCKAGFDVIDLHPLTDSYPPRCKDHVHYEFEVFDMMEKMLEQYKVHDNKKLDENEKHGKIKRCISKGNI